MYRLTRLLTAAVFAVATTQSANAQSADGDWILKCDDNSCSTSRGLRHAESGRLIATFIAVIVNDDPDARFGVALSLGAALRPGILFVPGEGEEFKVPFEVCYPDGCRALRPFDAAEEARFAGADEIEIRFIAYNTGETISVGMPLTGLSELLTQARAKLRLE